MLPLPAFLFQTVLRLVQPTALQQAALFQRPEAVSIGETSAASAQHTHIPKRIWTYWNQEQPDRFVQQCIQSWRLQCPDYEVVLVHPGNLHQHVPDAALPAQFAQLHPTKQSDWLRLFLVALHGGYWLDASTLLTHSLDWMHSTSAADTASFVGFYLEKFTHNPQYPVIESWAFGAAAQSAFVTAWQKEFHHALIERGTEAYLHDLRARSDWEALKQGIRDPHYLLIHITAQKILRDTKLQEHFALYKAEDSAYFYHHRLRWKWYLLYPQLCIAPCPAAVSPIIKLRGGERRHFTEMLAQHGGAKPESLWAQAFR